MLKKLVVSKNSVGFEVLLDSKVEVNPLPHESFNKATLDVLATKHKVVLESLRIVNRKKDQIDLAINYFNRNGFQVKEV